MELAVVIINYKTADLVIQCLEFLLPQLYYLLLAGDTIVQPEAISILLQTADQ
jgi:hypothetical protein